MAGSIFAFGFVILKEIPPKIREQPKTYTNYSEKCVQIVKEYLQYSQKKIIVNAIPSKSGKAHGCKQDV